MACILSARNRHRLMRMNMSPRHHVAGSTALAGLSGHCTHRVAVSTPQHTAYDYSGATVRNHSS